VRNFVNGATLGFGDKVAAAGNAAIGAAPDYASALAAERAQSAQAMAPSPGGVGTAVQILGMAAPAGAIVSVSVSGARGAFDAQVTCGGPADNSLHLAERLYSFANI
jgi:hypothetical protein